MATLTQLTHKKYVRPNKRKLWKTPALRHCPQKKGVVLHRMEKKRKLPAVFRLPPKKPNSARRAVCRVVLSTKKRVFGYIRGLGHNVTEYNHVLIHGGRIKDLPGIKYRLIRGALDFVGVWKRRTSRSAYGTHGAWRTQYDWREVKACGGKIFKIT